MPQDAMTSDTKPQDAPAPSKERPVFRNQSGSVELAMWANQHEVEGKLRTFHNITMKRSYMDKDENWQKTDQFRPRDIGDAIAVLQSAQQFLMKDTTA